MIPDNQNTDHTQADFAQLMTDIGKSQRWIAERTGISERRLRYLMAGGRLVGTEFIPTAMSYPEFHLLQELAQAAMTMRKP